MKSPVLIFVVMIAFALLAYTVFMYATSASVDIAQAQAQIETAKAAQEAARAAQITGSGLAGSSVLMTLILFLVVLNVTMVIGFMLYVRLRPLQQAQVSVHKPAGKWLPGPNAHWGKIGDNQRPQIEAGEQSMSTDDMIKLLLVRQLGGNGGQDAPLSLPAPQERIVYRENPIDDLFSFAEGDK